MTSPFENPDILRLVFEYEGMLPRHTSVSRTIYRVLEERASDFQEHMDKVYPLWDLKVDSKIWLYLLNKALFNEDMEAYAAIYRSGVIHDMKTNNERDAATNMLLILGTDKFEELGSKYFPGYIDEIEDLLDSIEIDRKLLHPYRNIAVSRETMYEYENNPTPIDWLNNVIAEKYPQNWNKRNKDLDITDENQPPLYRYVKAVALGLPIPANINNRISSRKQQINRLLQGVPSGPYTRELLSLLSRDLVGAIAGKNKYKITAPFIKDHMIELILQQQ